MTLNPNTRSELRSTLGKLFVSLSATSVIKVQTSGESRRPTRVRALPGLLSPPSTSILDVKIVLGAQLAQLLVY